MSALADLSTIPPGARRAGHSRVAVRALGDPVLGAVDHPLLAIPDRPGEHPARVPQANVIGEINEGFTVAMATLDRSRLGVAAQALGIAQGATDYAVAYARERKQFGKPINASAMAMLFCSDIAMAIAVEAVQVLGGYGYVSTLR